MLHIEKYGAIDIGSNAIRLLITTVIIQKGEEPRFKKTSLVRVPIRLGSDVFVKGNISKKYYNRLKDALKAFSLLMKVHNIDKYRACATSAMRDAKNGAKVVKKLYKKTGINIEIINGSDEASIIATTNIKEYLKHDKVFLNVDVGGGSTELTVYANKNTVASRSFKLGTVRLINNLVENTIWEEVKVWIETHTNEYSHITLLGTGGNINSTYKTSGTKIGKPLSYNYLNEYFKDISKLTYEERIAKLDMNPDRADVIIPALKIYLSAMKWSGAECVYVPKIGLSDGIVRSLYNENNNRKDNEKELNPY